MYNINIYILTLLHIRTLRSMFNIFQGVKKINTKCIIYSQENHFLNYLIIVIYFS